MIEVRRKYPCQLVLVTHDISEAVRLTSHVLVLAAHPFRKVAFFENPAFNHKIGCSDRDSNLFYDTVREIHSLLRSASGRLYQ